MKIAKNVPSIFRKNQTFRKTFCQVYQKSKTSGNVLLFFFKLQMTKNDRQNFEKIENFGKFTVKFSKHQIFRKIC